MGLRCHNCHSERNTAVCFKCGKPTQETCEGWIEPAIPSVGHIRELCAKVGYAVGLHGSLERDVDLIACPWTDDAIGNYELIEYLKKELGCSALNLVRKPQGRYAVTLQLDGYFKPIDLSIMPTLPAIIHIEELG